VDKVTINSLRERAKANPKRIIFPEIKDERIKHAVEYIKREKIAIPLFLSSADAESYQKDIFANLLFEHKKKKGMTFEGARELMEDDLFYSAMMVRLGFADGLVVGAAHSTASVMRAVLECLDVDDRIKLITSCFLMVIPNCNYGQEGMLIFADCGVIPSPTSEQLAKIAIASSYFAQDILEISPRVAMLSFSSKGSASNADVEKVREAVEKARLLRNDIFIDGELQVDSAIVPEIASRKLKGSDVAGKANILIFPDLNSGNISYKLTERLASARAIGPILLGTVQPCCDLSRGCSVEDIIDCTAITVIRAQKKSLSNPLINLDKNYADTCF